MNILDKLLGSTMLSPFMSAEGDLEPEAGGGAGVEQGGASGGDAGSGGAEEAPRSLRDTINDSVEEIRRTDRTDRGDGRDSQGRLTPNGAREAGQRGAAARAQNPAAAQQAAPQGGENSQTNAEAQQGQQPRPPQGWSKEAQAEWERLPPAVQAAVSKRETDTQRGVDELKSRYGEIDRSLEPHMEAIRRHGHTPGAAVAQLFGWFQALANKPDEAFPALMRSFNYDSARLAGGQRAAAAPAAGADQSGVTDARTGAEGGGATAPAELTPVMRQELERMFGPIKQQVDGFQQLFQQQQSQKTQEVIETWAKDKPHFTSVRVLMGRLIASGAVPPTQDGRVDLDTAYDMAVNASPEVRTQLATEAAAKAEQERKNKEAIDAAALAQQATQARRASSGSLRPAAPGTQQPAARRDQKKGSRSVRESITEAVSELSQQ
jgi:hypothetical protein